MLRLPPKMTAAGPMRPDMWNQLLDYVRSLRIVPSTFARPSVSSYGTAIAAGQEKIGAAGRRMLPFELSVVEDGGEQKIRVAPSTIAGGSSLDIKLSPASGEPAFSPGDENPCLIAPNGTGVIQGGIEVASSGEVTSRWIEFSGSLTATAEAGGSKRHYFEIGTVLHDPQDNTCSVANSRYGPVEAAVCRDWFSSPPAYGVTFQAPVFHA